MNLQGLLVPGQRRQQQEDKRRRLAADAPDHPLCFVLVPDLAPVYHRKDAARQRNQDSDERANHKYHKNIHGNLQSRLRFHCLHRLVFRVLTQRKQTSNIDTTRARVNLSFPESLQVAVGGVVQAQVERDRHLAAVQGFWVVDLPTGLQIEGFLADRALLRGAILGFMWLNLDSSVDR